MNDIFYCEYCAQPLTDTEKLQDWRLIAENIHIDVITRKSYYCTNKDCPSKTTRGMKGKIKPQFEEEIEDDIVKEAEQYRERLEERLKRLEHAVCVVAQAVAHLFYIKIDSDLYTTKQLTKYQKELTQLISDLQPEPDTPSTEYDKDSMTDIRD